MSQFSHGGAKIDEINAPVELIKSIFGVSNNISLEKTIFKSECYIIGFAHIIHSVSDTMAKFRRQ